MRLKLGLLFVCLLAPLCAQVDRIPASIDETRQTVLRGHKTPRAVASADLGPADPNLPMGEIALQFKPTAAQQQALAAFLTDVQNPASRNFHHWLKPEEFGDRFGLSQSDYDRAAGWLKSHGFQVAPSARGRSWILFHGTVAQVRSAFGADVHRYRVKGEMHYSVADDPRLPEALADVVGSVTGLDDFLPVPQSHVVTPRQTSAGGSHTLSPDDAAAIYNFSSLLQAGFDGTGQTIVIVGQSRLPQSDTDTFRALYNMPSAMLTAKLVPGVADPGITSSLYESNLDVQWAGAAARKANLVYIYANSFYTALQYAVDQNLGQVISASFGFSCETLSGSLMAGYQLTAQQANAQGITWVNATGDSGAAGCDTNGSALAQDGLAVTTPANVPEVTAVGGTEFAEGSGTYWKSTNSPTLSSALGYIPETAWNDSAATQSVVGGGGGVSTYFAQPSWQAGSGVPAGGFRAIPDVSFSAGGHDPYNIISSGVNINIFGTSAATPLFAGMLAVLNQYLGANGLGNINPALYALAQTAPAAFHDITTGDNKVPCAGGSPDCQNGSLGYTAAGGYDYATGLGSVDLQALADAWKGLAKPAHALISLTLSSNPLYQHAPDSAGLSWGGVKITLQEEAGVPAVLTSFTINGARRASRFSLHNDSGERVHLDLPRLQERSRADHGTLRFQRNGCKWKRVVRCGSGALRDVRACPLDRRRGGRGFGKSDRCARDADQHLRIESGAERASRGRHSAAEFHAEHCGGHRGVSGAALLCVAHAIERAGPL